MKLFSFQQISTPISVGIDPYPPSRVIDLVLSALDSPNKTFTVQFTAPGDDLDHGIVVRYEIKYSTKYDDLRENNFSVRNATIIHDVLDVVKGPIQPVESGLRETISFRPSKMNQGVTYYVALRGIDKAGKAGKVSNIVSIRFQMDMAAILEGLSEEGIIGTIVGVVFLATAIALVTFLVNQKHKQSHQPVSTDDNPSNKV